jgi:hypothetical protein
LGNLEERCLAECGLRRAHRAHHPTGVRVGRLGCWRISERQQSQGQDVQTLSSACSEQPWFRASLCNFGSSVNTLPTDHHLLVGALAPRGLLVIDNTGMEWFGNVSCYSCSVAARRIFQALAVETNMGYSQVGGHDHCAFPSSQQSELTAHINQFLNGSGSTAVMRTDGGFSFDESLWVDWSTPTLQ